MAQAPVLSCNKARNDELGCYQGAQAGAFEKDERQSPRAVAVFSNPVIHFLFDSYE